jgi:hypothetical protein
MTFGVFVKSFRLDLGWLAYSLQLLEKFWLGEPPEVVIALDPDCQEITSQWGLRWPRYVYTEPWQDGYSHAMALKACADQFLPQSELILLLDSDTMLTGPCSVADITLEDKPVIEFRHWNDDDAELATSRQVWQPVSLASTGLELAVDFMVSVPRVYWRSTFALTRACVEQHHQKPFLEALRRDHPYDWRAFLAHPKSFCENQTLSMIATLTEPSRYVIRNPDLAGWFKTPFKQYWSHDRLPVAELEALLRGNAPDAAAGSEYARPLAHA